MADNARDRTSKQTRMTAVFVEVNNQRVRSMCRLVARGEMYNNRISIAYLRDEYSVNKSSQ
jgi:hypothetical protein